MPRRFKIALLCLVAAASTSGNEDGATENAASAALRQARERFNEAIVRRDPEAIGALLAPTYHIVTGRSAQSHGADEQLRSWAAMFDRDPTLVYHRSPREVRVNQAWGLAEELGDWTGSYDSNGAAVHASGVYAAKWQRAEGGEWLLQAEVFTTLDCKGPESGCVRPNPIRSGRRPNDEARRQHGTEVKMQQIGRTFLLDYGALQIRVRYLSDSKLAWEQIKGPAVGLKAEEEYGLAVIRPDVYFIWWQEKDSSVVSQVVDFEKGLVHTTWLSPEKQLASFHGTVTPKDS